MRIRLFHLLAGLMTLSAVSADAQTSWKSVVLEIRKRPAALEAFLKERDISASDWNGWALVHWAARTGDSKVLRLLIAKGANVNQRTAEFQESTYPIVLAARSGDAEAVIVLIRAGANLEDGVGAEVLREAVAHDTKDGAKMVGALGKAGVGLRGDSFRECITQRRPLCLDAFLANGANVNDRGSGERVLPPLTEAVWTGDPRVVRVILKYRPDLNAKSTYVELVPKHWEGDQPTYLSEGWQQRTALMTAATRDRLEIVKLLVDAGADLSITDGEGRTALDLARQRKARRVEEYLASRQAKLDDR